MARPRQLTDSTRRRKISEDIRKDFLMLTSGSEDTSRAWALRMLFGAASTVYREAVLLRNDLYTLGLLRRMRLPLPSISVGNVTVGGTGKTPFVEYTVQKLKGMGLKPAVIARGYGPRMPKGSASAGANDESLLLTENTGVPVVLGADRRAAAFRAAELGADVVVLDDAFQHLKVMRDLDVVLLDSTAPFGFGKMLPRGLLREPLRALGRADLIVITRVDLARTADISLLKNAAMKAAPGKPVALTAHRSDALIDVGTGQKISVREVEDAPVGAFCGIGNPYSFGLLLRRLGTDLVLAKRFEDHHLYSAEELVGTAQAAEKAGARFLITTQKDAVKIPKELAVALSLPLYYLQTRMEMLEGEDVYTSLILSALENFHSSEEEKKALPWIK